MKICYTVLLFGVIALSACTQSPQRITSTATGAVITNITAHGTGGGVPFDGSADSVADLEDLVKTAWGRDDLGLHRGHAPIQNVLEVFLGITHREMHVLMEQEHLNLAAVCRKFGFAPDNLTETLTASFVPFIEAAADRGTITPAEIPHWTQQVRTAFHNRIHWNG